MDWFKHDINAHDDIKIKKLLKKHGFSALGIYWFLVEIIFSKGGKADFSEAIDELSFIDGLTEEESEEQLHYLCNVGLLYLVGSDLRSHRIDAELQFNEERIKKKAEAGRKGGLAKASKCQADAKQSLAKSSREENIREHKITKDSNNITVQDNYTDSFKSREEESVCSPQESQKNQTNDSVKEQVDKTTAAYNGVKAHDIAPIYQDRFNRISGVVRCERMTIKRELAVDSILQHFSSEEIEQAFTRIEKSNFLRGANSSGFVITFDWLFNIDHFTKVLEGNYDNHKGKKEVEKEKTSEETYGGMSKERYDAINKRNEELLAQIAEEERRNGTN